MLPIKEFHPPGRTILSMDPNGEALSRRQALRLGSGATLALAASPLAFADAASPRAAAATDIAIDLRFEARRAAGGWSEATPIELSPGFTLGGLSWGDRGSLGAQLRVRRGGLWESWIVVPGIEGHLPDSIAAPSATAPVWYGDADLIQFRTSRVPHAPRARLVSTAAMAGGIPVGNGGSGGGRHHAVGGAPAYVTRRAWHAERPRAKPSYGRIHLAFVHHTVTANAYRSTESAAIVRSIQHYHRDVLHWDDIGYNALVDRYGQIFEGRAGGLDRAVIGAQAQGFNSLSTGVAVIGNHAKVGPTEATLDALSRYLAWKLAKHGVPAAGRAKLVSAGGESSRTRAGHRVVLPRICGHRLADFTECPGDALYRALPDLRDRVQRRR